MDVTYANSIKELEGLIASLPRDDQALVEVLAQTISKAVQIHGEAGTYALATVVIEVIKRSRSLFTVNSVAEQALAAAFGQGVES